MEHQKLTTRKHFSHQKKEDIEAEWTKLLLDWVRICGQVRTSLDQVDFMDLLRTYGDMFVQCEPLPENLDLLLEQRFPKLQLSSKEEANRKPYITATVLLYFCITGGSGNMVINICLYLPLEQQTMVRRLCEELRDKEITVANVDAAIAGAFESSSEILVKHDKQNSAAGLWCMVSKQTSVSKASSLPETSFSAINTKKFVLNVDNAKAEITKESSNIQSVVVKPVTSSTTYVFDTVESNSFVCQYPDETRIGTTNVMESGINTHTGNKEESCNVQVSMKSEAIMTSQKVFSVGVECSNVKGECNKIKNTLDASEKNDPKRDNLPINRSGTVITLQSSSFDNLDNNASKNRTSTAENSENVFSTGENGKQKSMALNSLESFDQTAITCVSKDFGGIDMLYLKSPFMDQSSIFVYPEQPSSKTIVSETTVSAVSEPKYISKYKIGNMTHETLDSLTELEKPVANNAAIIIDTPFFKSGFPSKSSVVEYCGNTKTLLFQDSVFNSRNNTDDKNNAGDGEVGEEFQKEKIGMEDTPEFLMKWQETKAVDIGKLKDESSDDLTEISNGGAHQNTFETRNHNNENIKADVMKGPTGDMNSPCTHTYTNHTTHRRKSINIEDSNTSVEKVHLVVNKLLEMNTSTRKDAVKKTEIKEQEAEQHIKDNMKYHIANYTHEFENNSKHNENKQVFLSHKIRRQVVQSKPYGSGNGKNGRNWKILSAVCAILVVLSILIICLILFFGNGPALREHTCLNELHIITRRHNLLDKDEKLRIIQQMKMNPSYNWPSWECSNGLCQKTNQSEMGCYESLSRCTLLCSGPQLWPHPTGQKYFGNQIAAIAKYRRHKYIGSSQIVSKYLDEAFYLFERNLARLEVTEFMETAPLDLALKELYIEMDIDSALDPKLRIDTNESYALTVEMVGYEVKVTIKSPSFHGVRHGLETLSQLILLDQNTGYLITLTNITIEDAPSFKYRGLMIDTARNHIPIKDLMRTIDAMSMCKLNTFHWRLSEVTFPKLISKFPKLFENNGFNTEIIYTTNDIELLVKKAGLKGIRVLIEVASPEPAVKSTSWTSYDTEENSSLISEALCLKMKARSFFNILEALYSFIIQLTKVEDIFHLSNSLLVFIDCFELKEDRERFLEKAQAHLTSANNGTIPKLPVIWYNERLMSKLGWMWHDFGVQLYEEKLTDTSLDKYKLIQSSRWDLSCKMVGKEKSNTCRSWQQMYDLNKRPNIEALTLEGGEALLWLDMVDTDNLDNLLWPRLAAVAERFWSGASANQSASAYEYLRLDAQRWRMMTRGVEVEAVWPTWCNYSPCQCFDKINN